ncbi:MAG: triosephosphate isomerase, partial [Peptostreptococcaceae bacterium]|nr:triosephosphate isomerase [Peptostreptococcaceae bacterium]
MRKPIIAGNWKMHKTIAEAVEFVNDIKDKVNNTDVEAVICAPFTLLKDLKEATKGTNIKIGAQNMHYAEQGAFTGEISAPMLKELNIDYVVLGH